MLGMKEVSRDQPPWAERDSASKKMVSVAGAAHRFAPKANIANKLRGRSFIMVRERVVKLSG
jgi:hypothetical protein